MDGPPVEQSASGFEGALLATGFGYDIGAASDLVALGAALAGPNIILWAMVAVLLAMLPALMVWLAYRR